MNFQDVILTLNRYWGAQGCVVLQPQDLPMGAGTFHPATVLRSLGPEPWRCAYVQPCRRPGDARYGENPNRLGHYYQYQVLLKPSPERAQELYLGSLEAIGIDLRRNDIRFVEDDWESPTLGAWGLGWEVWLNGLEVTQYTYFQQVGGIPCEPFPVELTYGLERLTMALQGVDDVYQLQWVDGVTYGDVFRRNEIEQSRYNFELADVDALMEEFNQHFRECSRLAELGQALPAYDQCILTSHTFNLLDARGAISVAERQNYIRRIRELAVRCSETWVAHSPTREIQPKSSRPASRVAPAEAPGSGPGQLLVELQCEELPARFVRPALDALARGVLDLLSEVRHGPHRVYATPRRLAVVVDDVEARRPVTRQLVTGPPADRAFVGGEPGPAALGFARARGVDVSALRIVDGPKGSVVAVEVEEGGEATTDLLAQGLESVILALPFARSMEWGEGGIRWGRPLRHVAVVLGGVPLVGTLAGVPVDGTTVGHRLAGDRFSFRDEATWLAGLRERAVEPDIALRSQRIRELLDEAAHKLESDPIRNEELLEEVTHLVEAPTLVIGEFDPSLLELPPRLLVESMQTHQRYFPVHRDDALTQYFAVISNNPWGDAAQVADGNARVLRARFDDARFFYAEDQRRRLEEHGEQLTKMRWIRGLSTMADKQARIAELACRLAPLTGADPELARRAGSLSKCDLVTQMVGEFPELQGHMGRLYALAQGEPDAVAQAIEEQYLPRFAEDDTPSSPEGMALALADRLDTLVGCFAIGMVPKGGGDPQGLRRAALGVVRIIVDHGLRADVGELYEIAIRVFHEHALAQPESFDAWLKARGREEEPVDARALIDELVAFTLVRYRAAAVQEGATPDLVDAVLAASPADPLLIDGKVRALRAIAGQDDFKAVMETFKRVLNITRGHDLPSPAADELTEPSERSLLEAVVTVEQTVDGAVARLDYESALDGMLTLQAPVAHLFDDVMVESDDPAERRRRLGLLIRVARIFLTLADFSRISTR